MSIHVVIYKAEDESQGSVGCPACKEGLLAVPSLALPTPAVTAYSPHPCPHLMSLPEGGGGAGPRTACGHLPSAPPATSRGVCSHEALGRPASRCCSSAGARPRHTFPIPSWAGELSTRSRGPARRAAAGSWALISAPVTT